MMTQTAVTMTMTVTAQGKKTSQANTDKMTNTNRFSVIFLRDFGRSLGASLNFPFAP